MLALASAPQKITLNVMGNKIKLLNGKEYDKSELIQRMCDDDFYYGFLGKNALSSSSIKDLLDGRYFDKTEQRDGKTQEAFKAGRLIHLAVLEPHRLKELNVAECVSKSNGLYKSLVDEAGSAEHVYTRRMVDKAEKLASIAVQNNKELFSNPGLEFELPEIGGVLGFTFRGKADMIIKDFDGCGKNVIIDLKTTSRLDYFKQSAVAFSYDIQLYLYCHLFDVLPEDFYWLGLEKRTGRTELFRGSNALYDSGREKTEMAIEIYVDGIL